MKKSKKIDMLRQLFAANKAIKAALAEVHYILDDLGPAYLVAYVGITGCDDSPLSNAQIDGRRGLSKAAVKKAYAELAAIGATETVE